MNFHVLTLFPDMVMDGLHTSIIGRAVKKGCLSIEAVNIRDYSTNKHGTVDDYPYGGGAGMVMQAEPIYLAYQALCERIANRQKQDGIEPMQSNRQEISSKPRVIYLTPQGKTFTQQMATELSKEQDLIFLCGHYEGVDERVLNMIVTDEVSIGDYVLTGGELPAMVMIDTISRLVPGVLNNDDSAVFESFHSNLLEYPQYTRPAEFMGQKVPDILLSGDHAKVEQWRYEQSLERTRKKRPDLLEHATKEQREAWLGTTDKARMKE